MSHARILIVHPDASVTALMTSMLQTLGHRIEEAPNERVAVRMLEQAPAKLVLAGVTPDDPDALEFLTCVRRKMPNVPVVVLFTAPHADRAREAILRGAAAVLRFPIPANALRAAVAQALGEPEAERVNVVSHADMAEAHSPRNGNGDGHNGNGNGQNGNGNGNGNGYNRVSSHAAHLLFDTPPPPRTASPQSHEAPARTSSTDDPLVGEDPMFSQAIDLIRTIAPTAAPALIVGERGTGKSRLARLLHDQGPRRNGPFVEASCANLRESVLDVDLFGRRNGGYSEPDRAGKVELARGGTLFLDDVSALTPDLQLKLLRLLRDGLNEPVGAKAPEPADVRVVMGTREDLASLVPDGRFRQDLYYRIGVVTLKLPPLRLRGSDLDRLAEHLRERFAKAHGKDVRSFAPETIALLRAHSWPGNVQELAEVIERAVLVCRGQRIESNHLALIPRDPSLGTRNGNGSTGAKNGSPEILPLKEALEGPERRLILEALEALHWNRQETARVLDINRTTLYKKMKKYGLLFDEPVWAN